MNIVVLTSDIVSYQHRNIFQVQGVCTWEEPEETEEEREELLRKMTLRCATC
jgi:hypothetical protein